MKRNASSDVRWPENFEGKSPDVYSIGEMRRKFT